MLVEVRNALNVLKRLSKNDDLSNKIKLDVWDIDYEAEYEKAEKALANLLI